MADESQGRAVRGFVLGVLVAGMIAAGVFLSQQPPPTQAPSPAPQALPMMEPPPAAPPQPATPREQADALFNEAMMAEERKDAAALAQVLPGALAAYRGLGALDDDGRYHLALLELAGNQLKEARATCAALLEKNPNHLLALGVSVRVEQAAGNLPAARDFAQRLLKAYDAEAGRPLPEYQDHQRILPTYRTDALALTK